MLKMIKQKTKTLHIRSNGRSADYITPNFIYGCAGGCRNSYCYVMRNNYEKIYINKNIDQILQLIDQHVNDLPEKIPNQTDAKYWTYDIGCSTDVALHYKHTNWLQIFDFFKKNAKAKATFATKYVNNKLLDFKPEQKVRLRFSLMPQSISSILEPKTSLINDRIKAVNSFVEASYDVHLNFSPIVAYDNWLDDYAELFKYIDSNIDNAYKDQIKAECIFLTHNLAVHERNLLANKDNSEALIWQPIIQENKVSEYGGSAVRYKARIKSDFIRRWSNLHAQIIPWNEIRYIF